MKLKEIKDDRRRVKMGTYPKAIDKFVKSKKHRAEFILEKNDTRFGKKPKPETVAIGLRDAAKRKNKKIKVSRNKKQVILINEKLAEKKRS